MTLLPPAAYTATSNPNNHAYFQTAFVQGEQTMNTDILTPTRSKRLGSTLHRRILQVHGALLLLVAVSSALYATVARLFGVGVYAFLQQDPITWTGLIQAYLLMAIIAALIWLGATETKVRKWHVVGALAHLPPVIAVIFSWGAINSFGLIWVASASLAFHLLWVVIETLAAFYPDVSPQ
jgi:hypothetical protein